MSAFAELSKYFSKGIVQTAADLGYSESNLMILSGDEKQLRASFPEIWNNILSCSHNRDTRSPLQYAQDLVASWVFEDCLIQALNDAGLPISHAGADRNRELLPSVRVSARSDAAIRVKGRTVPLEIMSDFTGYWTRTNKIDLRDNKYCELRDSHSLFIGISTADNKAVLLDFSLPLPVEFIPRHRPYGWKPAYSIRIQSDNLIDFKMPLIIQLIGKMI